MEGLDDAGQRRVTVKELIHRAASGDARAAVQVVEVTDRYGMGFMQVLSFVQEVDPRITSARWSEMIKQVEEGYA